ncbi:MotA/TolQ/ExbB proton channel family protein [Corticimicrobacter populi]|uniref:Flagellar motor protein MotA n=1 Tax=Corticimicrobacter populi TaxID=2175229 RepID=A0A2V1K1A5_9BURK|nr:MotA/TolQ/ExbB proton channel family protein [Corticimicrobacter populi]PWF22953.1 flagellar motor protein MotA [Corticimicrobacter populi]
MFSLIVAAGWPVWPLLATSILTLALIIERSLSLRRTRILPAGLAEQAADMLQRRQTHPEALSRLHDTSPLGVVLAAVLEHRTDTPERQRQYVEDAGHAVAFQLSRYLPALATIAVAAPLMGLFGTVIGMIEIFGAWTPTGSDPTQMARGISVALYNTAFGILIAIPALVAHRFFRSRTDIYLDEMERQAARLSTLTRANTIQ